MPEICLCPPGICLAPLPYPKCDLTARRTKMTTFHITLNVEVEARDLEEARAIALDLQGHLATNSVHPYKLKNVEADDVEES